MKYVMADVHGQFGAFDAMLEQIKFSDNDELIVVGDVIDRGPDGIKILKRILEAHNMGLILGNHEEMMLKSFRGTKSEQAYYGEVWRSNGGYETEWPFMDLPDAERESILDVLEKTPDWLDIDAGEYKYRLVHGAWYRDRRTRLWESPSPYQPARDNDGRRIVVGHTPVFLFDVNPHRALVKCGEHMKIFRCDGFIGIDCGCGLPESYKKRALGCLRLDDQEEFYIKL